MIRPGLRRLFACVATFRDARNKLIRVENTFVRSRFLTHHRNFNTTNRKRMMTDVASVVKSPNDQRNYRIITLDNGLRALLISDSTKQGGSRSELSRSNVRQNEFVSSSDSELDSDNSGGDGESSYYSESDLDEDSSESDGNEEEMAVDGIDESRDVGGDKNRMSAAALCVGVGSFSDPPDIPGLAHFLEHMVFMGSKKYPNDNDFDAYLAKHGGSSNAFTDCEQTTFHFDVQKSYFHGALDRFAQFFIHPLMNKDSVDREIEAVDSEFLMGLPKDDYRFDQLLGTMVCDQHPMGKFMWGNAQTLKTKPAEEGIDIYSRLREFHQTAYLAQFMTLVVLSSDSLDQLEKWVKEIFSLIPSSSDPRPTFVHLPPPFDTSAFTRLYKVIPVSSVHRIHLTWALPSVLQHYKCKPVYYLGWLLGYEGKGSLALYLKKKFWAVELEGGNGESGFELNSCWSAFSVTITLTDEGLKHIVEIITAVFQYLALVRQMGPQERIFNEIKTIQDNEFRWVEEEEPQDYVEDLCYSMQIYAPEDYLTGNELLWTYDEELIKSFTDQLTYDRVNVTIMSSAFDTKNLSNVQKEPWFQTQYTVEEIPSNWLEQWRDAKPIPELHLPPPNDYIAEDFSLKEPDVSESEIPILINETKTCRLWYKKDNKFKAPRAYIQFLAMNQFMNSSAKNACLGDLFITLLELSLSEIAYDADVAELGYSIRMVNDVLFIKLNGFNDKLPRFFRVFIDHVADFKADENQFLTARDKLKREYQNFTMKPQKLNRDIWTSLLIKNHWTANEKLAHLSSCDIASLNEYVKTTFSRMSIEGLVQGNMTAQEAKELANYLVTKLEIKPLEDTVDRRLNVNKLKYDAVYHRTTNLNATDENCVITNYYQLGPTDLHQDILMDVLMMYMEEPCFDYLRTKRQLGYEVYSAPRDIFGILGYAITVCSQSTKFRFISQPYHIHCVILQFMRYLDMQIESFMKDFKGRVDRLKLARFNSLVHSIIRVKNIQDFNLKEEVDRNWIEIVDKTYVFNRLSLEIEELEQLTLDEFKQWSVRLLMPGPYRKKLSIQVAGNKLDQNPKKTSSAPVMTRRGRSDVHKKRFSREEVKDKGKKGKANLKKEIDEDKLRFPPNQPTGTAPVLKDVNGDLFIKDLSGFRKMCDTFKRTPAKQASVGQSSAVGKTTPSV